MDGRCVDSAYDEALRLQLGSTPARLVHSGVDLFVCLEAVPAAARTLSLRLDLEGDRRRAVEPAQLLVRLWPDGRVMARQGTEVERAPQVDVPTAQFRTAGVASPDGSWSAEFSVPLTWLGGTGATARLRLSLDGGRAGASAQWPGRSDEHVPASWGQVVVGPMPRSGAHAGSAFVDGRGGYVVVPFAAAYARPITLEAWARAVDEDCGTLIGGGFETGYWIGVCDGLVVYRRPGGTYTRRGQTAIAKGWHHVAVTVDSTDEELLYVDGVVDLHLSGTGTELRERGARLGPPALRPAAVEKTESLPRAPRMPWRIGSDAEAPAELDYLHAYVSEVRIWSGVRSQAELRRAAVARLSGREPGLVGLWRFADGLENLAGAGRAGLIGFASLAAEQRDPAVAPRPLPSAGPRVTPARPRDPPPWDGRLPAIGAATVKVDGWCRPNEYEDAAQIPLEPERAAVIQALLTDSALFVCTGVLLGRQEPTSALTLYVARGGALRMARGPDDLEIAVTADGGVAIRPQDDRTPGRDSTRSIVVAVVGRPTLDLQPDDTRPLDVPWWSAEVRIPLTALRPFGLDSAGLRLALRYSANPRGLPAGEAQRLVQGRWPPGFDSAVPASWGATGVTRESPRPPTTIDLSRSVPMDPTGADFDAACPTGVKHKLLYASNKWAKWPLVDPGQAFVFVEGTAEESHISDTDSPFIHGSHDVDMHITPRYADKARMLQGDHSLVLETESGGLSGQARALPGDRVIAAGRWVFDCGHAAKTEVHPTPIFVTDRLETRLVRPGAVPQQVRVIRIWVNTNPGAFSYSFSGTFTVRARIPGGSAALHPFAANVHADLPPIITRLGDSVQIAISPPAHGKFYNEIVLGSLSPGGLSAYGAAAYTVSLDEIDVLDDKDGGAPDCGDFDDGFHDCGEWTVAVNFNGSGKTIWSEREVGDYNNPHGVHQTFAVAGKSLRLHASGYEDDDLNVAKASDDFAGDDIGQSRNTFWELGRLDTLCCGVTRTFAAPGGAWRFRYRVSAGAPSLNVLPLAAHPFWKSRLAEEPNDIVTTGLGELTPTPSSPATGTHAAWLLEAPLITGGVRLLGSDEDRYRVTVNDFSTVTADFLEGTPAQAKVVPSDPWFLNMPESIKQLIGSKSSDIRVATPGDWGDLPYTVRVHTVYKVLPPDWGESLDGKPDARLVDLVTPDPAAEILGGGTAPGGWPLQAIRRLVMPWAWQHVAGDDDRYTILIPKVVYPGMVTVCEYNEPAALELMAANVRLIIAVAGVDGVGHVQLNGLALNTLFPDGKVRLRILSGPGTPRSVYQITAEFREPLIYTPGECAARHDFEAKLAAILGTNAVPANTPPFGFEWPKPDPPDPITPTLGLGVLYTAFVLGNATALDLVVSAAENHSALARLYDLDGVLLAESTPAGDGDLARIGAWAGRVPSARIAVRGLTAHQGLILQVVPSLANESLGTVGVSSRAW